MYETTGRGEQVVAASSEMWGEKYRDEVGLVRSEGGSKFSNKPRARVERIEKDSGSACVAVKNFSA